MAELKHYSLRWDQHASNLVAEAECFFQDEAFLDCTLSAEGQSLQAHRLILSAASPYLASLLRVAGDKQPILIFNEMPFSVLRAVVAFIYNGRVDVPESAVQPFLHAAQTLLLRGLSQAAASVKPSAGPPPPLAKPPGPAPSSGRRLYSKRCAPDTALRLHEVTVPAPHPVPGDAEQPFVVHNWRLPGEAANGKPPPGYLFKKFRLERPPVEETPSEPPPPPLQLPELPTCVPVGVKQEPIAEVKVEVEDDEEEDTNYPDPGAPVPLLVCKTSLQEDEGNDMSWQQEAEELPCSTCHKKYRSRYALNRHVLYECGKARKSFSCDECGKKVTRQDTLQKHKLIHLVQHMKEKEDA